MRAILCTVILLLFACTPSEPDCGNNCAEPVQNLPACDELPAADIALDKAISNGDVTVTYPGSWSAELFLGHVRLDTGDGTLDIGQAFEVDNPTLETYTAWYVEDTDEQFIKPALCATTLAGEPAVRATYSVAVDADNPDNVIRHLDTWALKDGKIQRADFWIQQSKYENELPEVGTVLSALSI